MYASEWEELAVKHGIENDKLKKTNKELLSALEIMTAEFEGEMAAKYVDGVMMYPSYQRDYKADKEQLDTAKKAITNAKQVIGDKG